MTYKAPLTDIRFVLEHVTNLDSLLELPDFEHVEPDLVHGMLEEAGRFCEQAIAPTNRDGDEIGLEHRDDGSVEVPESFKTAYQNYVAAGWGAVQHPTEFGGGGFPLLAANAIKEMITSANMAFSLAPLLTTGAVLDLVEHGDDELQQTFLHKMVTGEWAGTMNLSEPQAGSDVGAITTKAIPQDDGTYRIKGTKIWITYGEHDMAENIIHLVLARLPDAPPGTKGISLFIVPKFLVNDDGSLGEKNDVTCVSIEEKLGIHASPTCVMAYGENSDGAVGYIVGEPNKGMRQMFTMMNDARLGVGIEGLAIAERAFQQASQYAKERRQGKAPGDDEAQTEGQSLIIKHADVRRMLMTMKAYIEAMRCLTYTNAQAIDAGKHHPDEQVRQSNREIADILTPISKAWCTDLGVELTSLGIQIYGGMGYVEETGAAQHWRDARIAPIYEGTNGIQAMDLVGRKVPMRGGQAVLDMVTHIGQVLPQLEQAGNGFAGIHKQLSSAIDALAEATRWLGENGDDINDVFGAATPYLKLFGQTLGGWFLARAALGAQELLDSGSSDFDEAFLQSKIATARFYADNLLPQVHGLLPAVKSGAEELFAVPEDQLPG